MAELTTTPPTTLPPCRRYICSHDSSGKSIFHSSDALPYYHLGPIGGLARSYTVSSIPAKLDHDADLKEYLSKEGPASHKAMEIVQANQTGANLLVVDLAPGAVSAMHQTVSIDFSVVVIGRIEMELDNGEKVSLGPGDHIVQRGTMHRWYNASKTEPARFIATTLPCEPFDIAGKKLEEVHMPMGNARGVPSLGNP